MDFIDKDVLLQQFLEEGKLNDVQKGILFSVNWERTALLQVVGQAIYSLQEARDLLETVTLDAEEDKVVSRMVSVEENLEAAFALMVKRFKEDFEKKMKEGLEDEYLYFNDFEKLQARHKERLRIHNEEE